MKSLFLCFALACFSSFSFGQKPALDTSVLYNWPAVEDGAISNNGQYVQYAIRNQPRGSRTLVVQATNGNWNKELIGVKTLTFTDDNQKAVFMQGKDSLCVLTLGTDTCVFFPGTASFRLFKRGQAEFILYKRNDLSRELVLRNLARDSQQVFLKVKEYLLSKEGQTLVLRRESESKNEESLQWINLLDGNSVEVWKGQKADNLVLDAAGEQLAFKVEDSINGAKSNSFFYYKSGNKAAALLINDKSDEIEKGFCLESILDFNKEGSRLFFDVKEREVDLPNPTAVRVDVWSYMDPRLQSEQLKTISYNDPINYLSVYDLVKKHGMRLQSRNEKRLVGDGLDGDFVLFNAALGDESEWAWSKAAQPRFDLVSTTTRERRYLHMRFEDISPNRKYVILRDLRWTDFYSYEYSSGITRNITKNIPIPPIDIDSYGRDCPEGMKARSLEVGGYLSNDSSIIIYDKFDIWEVDLGGRNKPVCLTKGFGRSGNTIFRFAEKFENNVIPNNRKYFILSAFRKSNKDNGFYRISVFENKSPELLTMGPVAYYVPDRGLGAPVIEANDTNLVLVKRESASESPNYYSTNDFKKFTSISNVHPEKKYNWLSSELKEFRALNGSVIQGVLYKPENFDPEKKYPLIIHYYEKRSDNLNHYYSPAGPNADLNVPWFVSQDYLVFTTDISYGSSKPGGESCLNTVVGAIKFFNGIKYINPKKIGIQGHSFGGYETNYLISHSNVFAAAVSSSGISDLISLVPAPWSNGQSHYDIVENGQFRMGIPLWKNVNLYIANSPIFQANKIVTPVLLVSNKKDDNVPFQQGLELFSALRRLGKRAWMLQYDNGGHGLYGNDRMDYLLRMTEFFNHYLKDAPPARWMTQGIPASKKGIDNGMELDLEIKTPGVGLQKVDGEFK